MPLSKPGGWPMPKTLTVKLKKDERRKSFGVVAYEFTAFPDGATTIRECWEGYAEVYSDGISIGIPARVWGIAIAWLTGRAVPTPLMAGSTGDE
jgi:hypothetical protein